MIKLKACYSLKIPTDVEYSTEQAGAEIEFEISDKDAEHIPQKLSGVWKLLRQSVEAELHRNGTGQHDQASSNGNGSRLSGSNGFSSHGNGNGNGSSNGNGNGGGAYTGNDPGGIATRKQIGLLLSLARRNRNMNAAQTKQAVKSQFGCDLNDLTKAQASELIDELQNKARS